MKRVLTFFLCLLMLCGLAMPVFAVSLNEGNGALNAQFQDGTTSKGHDYVYYSPVRGANDNARYPLFIWLHGAGSGGEKRQQIAWYDIVRFASDEYQQRFEQGGCYVFAPRDPGVVMSSWEANDTSTLKSTIDEFISSQKGHIDMDRIYISGYSTGGSMVWNMATAYPNFFAAVIPGSALLQPSTTSMQLLKDVSVWIFCCDKDPYVSAQTVSAKPVFNALKSVTNRPQGVRISVFSQAVLPDYSKKHENGAVAWDCEHYTWMAITNDMHMYDGTVYAHQTTTDGTGKTISFPTEGGFISWLTQQHRTTENSSSGGKSKNVFSIVFGYIRSFFIRTFSVIHGLFTFSR